MGGEELQQLVLHVGEVERLAVDGRLVGLEVQGQRPVLDEFGSCAATGPVEEVSDPCLEFGWLDRRQAEVVEKVVPQLQVWQLPAAHQQEQGLERHLDLPESTAEGERALWIGIGHDDGAGPALAGFLGHGGVQVGDRLPGPAVQIQALGQFRRGWVWVDEEWVHGVGGVSARPVCPAISAHAPVGRTAPSMSATGRLPVG